MRSFVIVLPIVFTLHYSLSVDSLNDMESFFVSLALNSTPDAFLRLLNVEWLSSSWLSDAQGMA